METEEFTWRVIGHHPDRENRAPTTLAKFKAGCMAEVFINAILKRWPANVYKSFELQAFCFNEWQSSNREFKANGS